MSPRPLKRLIEHLSNAQTTSDTFLHRHASGPRAIVAAKWPRVLPGIVRDNQDLISAMNAPVHRFLRCTDCILVAGHARNLDSVIRVAPPPTTTTSTAMTVSPPETPQTRVGLPLPPFPVAGAQRSEEFGDGLELQQQLRSLPAPRTLETVIGSYLEVHAPKEGDPTPVIYASRLMQLDATVRGSLAILGLLLDHRILPTAAEMAALLRISLKGGRANRSLTLNLVEYWRTLQQPMTDELLIVLCDAAFDVAHRTPRPAIYVYQKCKERMEKEKKKKKETGVVEPFTLPRRQATDLVLALAAAREIVPASDLLLTKFQDANIAVDEPRCITAILSAFPENFKPRSMADTAAAPSELELIGHRLHRFAVFRDHMNDEYVVSALLHFYAACRDLSMIKAVFRDVDGFNAYDAVASDATASASHDRWMPLPRKDSVTCSAFISAASSCESVHDALLVLRYMRRESIPVTPAAMTSLLACMRRRKMIRQMRELLEAMFSESKGGGGGVDGLLPNPGTIHIRQMVLALTEAGAFAEAERWSFRMPSLDKEAVSVLLQACRRADSPESRAVAARLAARITPGLQNW